MGLAVEPISTQVIPRDRHAMFFATLGVIAPRSSGSQPRSPPPAHRGARGGGIFLAGQKGSSAMPHKRNPSLTEKSDRPRPDGARLCEPALENVALWHERDISHFSVERYIGPDAT
jgi:adenylosuccinate lyase